MIIITPTVGKGELILPYAQSFMMSGKNRILIKDFSHLRIQPYGGKLSPLVIEGYTNLVAPTTVSEPGMNGIDKFKQIEDFFDNALSARGRSLDQFVIREKYNSEGVDGITIPHVARFAFKGVLDEVFLVLKEDQNMIISYFIKFMVYPFKNVVGTKIKDAYWL